MKHCCSCWIRPTQISWNSEAMRNGQGWQVAALIKASKPGLSAQLHQCLSQAAKRMFVLLKAKDCKGLCLQLGLGSCRLLVDTDLKPVSVVKPNGVWCNQGLRSAAQLQIHWQCRTDHPRRCWSSLLLPMPCFPAEQCAPGLCPKPPWLAAGSAQENKE